MGKETQNRLWAALAKDKRELCRNMNRTSGDGNVEFLLDELFGHHNLTSDEEPSVQVEPRFKVGDKVRVTINGERYVTRISYYDSDDDTYKVPIFYKGREVDVWVKEFQLEPYTEETEQTKETMEEKELNLAELLKDCIGEEFWSPIFDVVKLSRIDLEDSKPLLFYWKDGSLYTRANGVMYNNTLPIIFPSRALYEKYPLDAKAAWMEWQEERKPKRWRSEGDETYWYIDSVGRAVEVNDSCHWMDNDRYERGNYFKTAEQCQQAAEAVRKTLEEFHAKNLEK